MALLLQFIGILYSEGIVRETGFLVCVLLGRSPNKNKPVGATAFGR
ncbi:MAG: hypothetical protein F6K35_17735 [Okeania sp. SIO2H7]|nr:hypothetical protein [Okeania sp. SIO2H7]